MPPASNEEQFKFLISCIRYSDNGKVNFEEVAKECDIVSKGAAAKRYERMMKFHGIHQSQMPAEASRSAPAPARGKTSVSAAASKKRKGDQVTETDINADDDEGLPDVKPEASGTKVKTEKANKKVKTEKVKEEPQGKGTANGGIKEEADTKDGVSDDSDAKTTLAIPQLDGLDKTALYNDFIAFGGTINQDNGVQAGISAGFPQNQSAITAIAPTGNEAPNTQESILIAD